VPLNRGDSHLSGPYIAAGLKRPTRKALQRATACLPYLVLLRVGFAVPAVLPQQRWSLTPPFHPYRVKAAVCFLWHFPSLTPTRVLPGTLHCGARTFLLPFIGRRLSGLLPYLFYHFSLVFAAGMRAPDKLHRYPVLRVPCSKYTLFRDS